uniref:ribonuclease H n=1 Tax=Leptobrachium leishanense TaxID=445787 RepID=A0A8C5PK34_9ANUR
MRVGNKDEIFMVDTGAEYSVVTKQIAPPMGNEVDIMGAMGVSAKYPFLASRKCSVGGHNVEHEFLYMPECPIQLLGRDILCKLQAQITFLPGGHAQLDLPENGSSSVKIAIIMPREEEWCTAPTPPAAPDLYALLLEIPGVWAEENPPGLAINIPPVYVELKPGATPVALRQYHIPQKAKQNIQIHLQRLKDHGILKFCVSPWNTPLLPVLKEGTQEYRPVQDLRAVNEATVTLHPVVPNPYNLLALIPGDTKYYRVLDLKDAFFCIRLAPASQPIFAFQWEESTMGARHQMTWTRLPQGFKNSPTIFGCALSQDLLAFNAQPDKVVLLQYVDDLLLASPTEKDCLSATKALLYLLQAGYRVSKKKASAACGSPTSQILPSRFIKPRRGENKTPSIGKKSKQQRSRN